MSKKAVTTKPADLTPISIAHMIGGNPLLKVPSDLQMHAVGHAHEHTHTHTHRFLLKKGLPSSLGFTCISHYSGVEGGEAGLSSIHP